MIYITYEKATGQIRQKGFSSQSVIPSGALEWLEVTGRNYSDLDITRLMVDIHSGDLIALPEQPSKHHTFDYATKQWMPDQVAAWSWVKQQREQKLTATDWTDTLSAKSRLGDALYAQWQSYRQALRDITLQADPLAIVWPAVPAT